MIRAVAVRCVLAGIVALPVAAFAANAADPAPQPTLAANIDAFIAQPRFAAAAWGIKIMSLDSGRVIYEHDANKLMVPASTGKLFTAALALATFGESHRVPTSLFASARPSRTGTLDGDLILYGYGDPTLGIAGRTGWDDQFAVALGKRGVRRVHGDVVADDSYFATPPIGSGWEAGDLQTWFAVPASTLSIGENIMRVTIAPGKAVGEPARIEFEPQLAAPEVVNHLRTVARGERTDVNLYRAPGSPQLQVFGSIVQSAKPRNYRLSIVDPARLAGDLLRAALVRHGIEFEGEVRSVHWPREGGPFDPAGAEKIADVWSPPLGDIVHSGIKRSQNLYLQNLLLMVGAKAAYENRPGDGSAPAFRSTESWGIRAEREWLAQIGAPESVALMEEGAGLSRKDLATPAALTGLLVHAARQPWGATLRDALPVAGVDGSLIGRMRNTAAQGRVHAKSGSMRYTEALAGYVTTAAGEQLAFALMLNNYHPPKRHGSERVRARDALDAIAILLAESTEPRAAVVIPAPRPPGQGKD
jgi:D-alanyl-D-alanine carboxypeptidase/D-alanyl-D-alanine-endopeptidase (penicillin-binding protein 4)